jgi:hypothetical protein
MEFSVLSPHRKRKAVVLFVSWRLFLVQGFVPSSLGQEPEEQIGQLSVNKAHVVVRSDPSGQPISLNGQRAGLSGE